MERMAQLKPLERRRDAVVAIVLSVVVILLGMLLGLGWVGLAPIIAIIGQWAVPAAYRRLKRRTNGEGGKE